MISSHLTRQMGLERIDDLRRGADTWRWVKLARRALDLSPSMSQPNQRPPHAVATLNPHRVS